jgi:hypothetical protein
MNVWNIILCYAKQQDPYKALKDYTWLSDSIKEHLASQHKLKVDTEAYHALSTWEKLKLILTLKKPNLKKSCH